MRSKTPENVNQETKQKIEFNQFRLFLSGTGFSHTVTDPSSQISMKIQLNQAKNKDSESYAFLYPPNNEPNASLYHKYPFLVHCYILTKIIDSGNINLPASSLLIAIVFIFLSLSFDYIS